MYWPPPIWPTTCHAFVFGCRAVLYALIGSSVNNCGGNVNDGTSGEYSKEDSWCFAPAEYRDHCDKGDGRNDEE